MDNRGRIGAGAIAFAGAMLTRETVIWAWNKLLDGIASLFKLEGVSVSVPNVPWLDIVGAVLFLVGSWLLYSSYRRKDAAGSAVPAPDTESDTISSTGTLAPLMPLESDQLYVGSILLSLSKLESEGVIELRLNCFNGSGHHIFAHKAAGKIHVNRASGSVSREIGAISTAHITNEKEDPATRQGTPKHIRGNIQGR